MLRAILNIDPRILATSLALLVIALWVLARRRVMFARLRRSRLAQQSAESGDGETSVLPLAQLASAVAVLDLGDLLAGGEGSAAPPAPTPLGWPTGVNVSPATLFPPPGAPATP